MTFLFIWPFLQNIQYRSSFIFVPATFTAVCTTHMKASRDSEVWFLSSVSSRSCTSCIDALCSRNTLLPFFVQSLESVLFESHSVSMWTPIGDMHIIYEVLVHMLIYGQVCIPTSIGLYSIPKPQLPTPKFDVVWSRNDHYICVW